MNALEFVITPVFRASHDHVMLEGEAGLRDYCAALHRDEMITLPDAANKRAGE